MKKIIKPIYNYRKYGPVYDYLSNKDNLIRAVSEMYEYVKEIEGGEGSGGNASWGEIEGDINNQTDLNDQFIKKDDFLNALFSSTNNVRTYADSEDTKIPTEKFLQKTLRNIETPEEEKDAVNKKYVDDLISELSGKVLRFKGFVSKTAPTGTIKEGAIWFESTTLPITFPINVKAYNATTRQWSATTIEYTPESLDLLANLNDDKGYYWFGNGWNMIDDNGRFLYVSTFDRVVGNPQTLYYLDTAYSTYQKGFYRFIPASGDSPEKFVLLNKELFKYVSTFEGETGDVDRLYFLDTEYDDYKVGFYRFIPATGTVPAKFVLIGSVAEVFTDVDELPNTDISKDTIYRIHNTYYEYQGQKAEKTDVTLYGPGSRCLNMAADNNGLHMEDANHVNYDYTWEQLTDIVMQGLFADELVETKTDLFFAEFFRLATNSYGPKDELQEVDGGYKLYYNPSQTAGGYTEIGGDSVQYVSTFEGVTGDDKKLYYLNTTYDNFKKGFYRYNGTTFVNINPKHFFIVSTFTGVEGDDESLYYLDTVYDTYEKGFYRYIEVEESGTTVGKFISIGSPELLEEITHAELKTLRDNAKLTPGKWYRITDYVTTANAADIRSARHPFDVIVRADSESTLNENAFAALHEGDTYFANNKLSAWELKYCLDNDTTRFSWADANGKGVVFRMKDEFENEWPYDFKNIQFKRWKVADSMPDRTYLNNLYMGVNGALSTRLSIPDTSDFIWAFTFSSSADGGEQTDMSLSRSNNNFANVYKGDNFVNNVHYGVAHVNNVYGADCTNNTFNDRCYGNAFGYKCTRNSFGSRCFYVTLGGFCERNSFGRAKSITFGNNCVGNALGDDVDVVTIGALCDSNTLLNKVRNIVFHHYVTQCLIGKNTTFSMLGILTKRCIIGDNCAGIVIKEATDQVQIGDWCQAITIGANCNHINILGGTQTSIVINATVLTSTSGTSASPRVIEFVPDKNYLQVAGMTSDGQLRIWNPADTAESDATIIDVVSLPTEDIDTDAIYRVTTTHYYHNDTELAAEPQGYKALNEEAVVVDANGLTVTSSSTTTPWAEVTDAFLQTLIDGSLVSTCGYTEASFFKLDTDSYDFSGNFSTADTYTLWHNATGEPTDWVEVSSVANMVTDGTTTEEVNGELQANAILDVEALPVDNIHKKSLYRLAETVYWYKGLKIDKPVGYAITELGTTNGWTLHYAQGITNVKTAQTVMWGNKAGIDELVSQGNFEVLDESDTDYENKVIFYLINGDRYDYKSTISTTVAHTLYHNPTGSMDGYIYIGIDDAEVDNVTVQMVDDKLQANAVIDVAALPTEGIKSKTLYRLLVDRYKEDGTLLPSVPTGYVSNRPAIVIIDETGITDSGTFYAWTNIDDDQMDRFVTRRQINEVPLADLMTTSTCFRTAANHYVYKDHVTKEQVYELYHNPTATANAFIKIGGDDSVEMDEITTEEVNGKLQANAVIEVDSLPITGIKTKTLYRRTETVYKHNGVEVPNVTIYKVILNDTIEATPEGMRYKPTGPVVAWNAANIGEVIQQAITDGNVETATWDEAEFFAFGDGEYDYETHFSRLLPGTIWQNADGTATGWKEVGGEPAIDEVTIVEEHGVLQSIAVIDVSKLPSTGMKVNSLYRKTETVMVPGLHIYTTYYEGGTVPVPEPVECYKPARAGVEFRSNEIYIDSVEHSYEELKAYRADWVAAGYIVACDFLDIDTDTNDGGIGYPNEGSYQFLNRDKYTYDTDPVPVVMNKIFQYTPGGEWESISTVELSNAAYNQLDYELKMDGTTYIVEI